MEETNRTNKEQIVKTVYSPLIEGNCYCINDIVRIQRTNKFTRIDVLCFFPRRENLKNGFTISKYTYIEPCGYNLKLEIIRTINLPFYPMTLNIKPNEKCFSFTLYFPPLPEDVTEINIIENKGKGYTFFTFLGVSVVKTRSLIKEIYKN